MVTPTAVEYGSRPVGVRGGLAVKLVLQYEFIEHSMHVAQLLLCGIYSVCMYVILPGL